MSESQLHPVAVEELGSWTGYCLGDGRTIDDVTVKGSAVTVTTRTSADSGAVVGEVTFELGDIINVYGPVRQDGDEAAQVPVVVFGPDDVLPATKGVRANRLQPGDVVWGVQVRKGFLFDSEPYTVGGPPEPHGDTRVLVPCKTYGEPVGKQVYDSDDLVMVQVRA